MKKIFLFLCLAALSIVGLRAQAPNTLTEQEIREGWRLLFDGQTGEGWRALNGTEFPTTDWVVEDGALKITKLVRPQQPLPQGQRIRRAGDIVTKETFKNFILKIDFKLTEGANSGMKYFVQENNVSCEFQFLDDEVHPDAKAGIGGNRRLGSLYDLIPATQNYTLDKYGFNTAMLVVDGNHVEHWINGTKVVEYERNTQMFDTLINTSKFNGNTTFGTQAEGRILLQDHSDEVWFRNIKIKILD